LPVQPVRCLIEPAPAFRVARGPQSGLGVEPCEIPEPDANLPHEAGLRLLRVPRAPKEAPASALIGNSQGIPE
jgi:hypothetical protein